MRLRSLIVIVFLLALSPAHADGRPNLFQRMKQAVTAKWIRTVDRLQQGVNARRIRTASVFSRIASGDPAGHRILFSDAKVTAFLSWSDPQSPNYNPHAKPDPALLDYPLETRAHILVIPNGGEQHIGAKLAHPIYLSDVRRTEQIMERAQKIARQRNLSTNLRQPDTTITL